VTTLHCGPGKSSLPPAVDTLHQPRNTATINLCTYLAHLRSSGTVAHVDLQLIAIQRSPCPSVSLTLLPNVKLRCDHHVVASHGPPSLLAISYTCANLLTRTGPMKWSERIQYSQTIGPMKRSRCEWDWSLALSPGLEINVRSPNLARGP